MPGSLATCLCGFVFLCLPTRAYRFSATSVALKELMVSPLSERPLLALLDFRYRDIEYSFCTALAACLCGFVFSVFADKSISLFGDFCGAKRANGLAFVGKTIACAA